jgi:hypothetical protein
MFGASEIEGAGEDVLERLSRYAHILGLDAHRVRAWSFVRAVLWSIQDAKLGPHFARVAALLSDTL